jgi:hypothetical protein
MNKDVVVTANESGAVVIPSKNPEFGYVRLETKSVTIDANGWARKSSRSALIKGAVADLKEMGLTQGQKLPGQIVIVESHEPTNPEDLEQDMKVAGDSGVPCTKDGQPIYRTSLYTTDMEATDTLIAHDNGDAIREAQAKLAKESSDLGA